MADAKEDDAPPGFGRRTDRSHHQNIRPKRLQLHEIIDEVDKIIESKKQCIASKPINKQIKHWTKEIKNSVNTLNKVMLPEFNLYANSVMFRWLIIGRSVSELTDIWKANKRRNEPFDSYHSIKHWLPYIVKKELDPSLCINGSYSTLRLYVRMWENRALITAIPKIRTDYAFSHAYTNSLREMNGWIRYFFNCLLPSPSKKHSIVYRSFNEKVRMMAVQRDMPVPSELCEQIALYRVYLEHHSHCDESDNEQDQCPTLDCLDDHHQQSDDDNNNDGDDDGENESENGEEQEEEKEIVVLSKEDKLKQRIKKLKSELSETKKELKFTQTRHCQAARERHVYQQLQMNHKEEMDKLHNVIVRKNQQLQQCSHAIIQLKHEFIEQKRFFKMFKQSLINSNALMKSYQQNDDDIESSNYLHSSSSDHCGGDNYSINTASFGSEEDSLNEDLYIQQNHKSYHRTPGCQTKGNRDKIKNDMKRHGDQPTMRVRLEKLQLNGSKSLSSRLSDKLSQKSL